MRANTKPKSQKPEMWARPARPTKRKREPKAQFDELLQAVMSLKALTAKHIVLFPATYHAVDIASKIVGWEMANKAQKSKPKRGMDFYKRVRKIYLSAAGENVIV